jgi:hypothetical protein
MKPSPGDITKFTFNDAWKDCLFLVIDTDKSELSNKSTCRTLNLKTMKEQTFYCNDLSVI